MTKVVSINRQHSSVMNAMMPKLSTKTNLNYNNDAKFDAWESKAYQQIFERFELKFVTHDSFIFEGDADGWVF